jgi:photoactive yellow protein
MIELTTSEAPLPQKFDPTRPDRSTAEDLDQQPFGVIALDGAGRILRYNLAEARFARLDRASVLGRKFFGEVAPCTAVPEFEGRFAQFVKGTAPALRFAFIFDFKFGAQQVEIELVRGEENRFWLLVNRRKFLAVRRDAQKPAPTQAELEPGEEERGVSRDLSLQRAVTLSPNFLASMRATWDRVAPQGWPLFCAEWGLKWGRLAVVDLETEALEKTGKTMRELPMREVMAMIGAHLSRAGWGKLAADFSTSKQGTFVITLERNALAEAIGFSEVPRCHLFAGFLRAIFSHLSSRLLAVREAACASQGHPRCSFVVASLSRAQALEAAIEKAEGEIPRALRLLSETRDA